MIYLQSFRVDFFKQCRRSTAIIDAMISAFEQKKQNVDKTTPILEFTPDSKGDSDARREHFTHVVMVNYFQLELDVRYHSKMRFLYEERTKNLAAIAEARDTLDSPKSSIKINELKQLQSMWKNYVDLFKWFVKSIQFAKA